MSRNLMGFKSIIVYAFFFISFFAFSGCGGGEDGSGNTDSLQITNQYLQYRSFENSNSNRFQGWVEITKNGSHIQERDLDEILLTNSSGSPIQPTSTGFYEYGYMLLDCTTTPCTESGPIEGTGFSGSFNYIPAGFYNIRASTKDRLSDTATVQYAGQLVLPVIDSTTMESELINEDLILSWTNPTDTANWPDVHRLTINIFDSVGVIDVLRVVVEKDTDSVTIPASLISQAMDLASGSLVRWEIQTRAYDANGMNCARGYSNRLFLPQVLSISGTFMQHFTHENLAYNSFRAFVGLKIGDTPAQDSDIADVRITDLLGNPLVTINSTFWQAGPYIVYNCLSVPCTQYNNIMQSGFLKYFTNIPAGRYFIEAEATDGQIATQSITYPGQLHLPCILSGSMQSQFVNGNLVLSWTNPTESANWQYVDDLHIRIYATDGEEVIFVTFDPSNESVTIPASLLSQANNLGYGSISYWHIQTRAFDANWMNFARGVSNNAIIR
jgi:hypothetical protein